LEIINLPYARDSPHSGEERDVKRGKVKGEERWKELKRGEKRGGGEVEGMGMDVN
jgi:hypothetical protein